MELWQLDATELARLYGLRWGVETDLRHLKQTMKMEILHCKTAAGVEKELAVFALVYNLVRRVMEEAGRRQGVEPERVSSDCGFGRQGMSRIHALYKMVAIVQDANIVPRRAWPARGAGRRRRAALLARLKLCMS